MAYYHHVSTPPDPLDPRNTGRYARGPAARGAAGGQEHPGQDAAGIPLRWTLPEPGRPGGAEIRRGRSRGIHLPVQGIDRSGRGPAGPPALSGHPGRG